MPARLSPAPPEGSRPPPFRCHKTVGALCSGCMRGGRVSAAMRLPPARGFHDNAAAGSAEAARPPLRLAGRSRRAMAEAVSAGRRGRLHPRAEGRGRRSRQARSGLDPVLGRLGSLEVRLATTAERDPARAAAALQGLLRGDVGGCRTAPRCSRGATSTSTTRSATICSCSITRRARKPFRKPKPQGRRHLPPAAPGGGGPPFRLLHRGRIRHRAAARGLSGPALPRARPLLRPASPIATSARSSCSGTASGPMSCTTAST